LFSTRVINAQKFSDAEVNRKEEPELIIYAFKSPSNHCAHCGRDRTAPLRKTKLASHSPLVLELLSFSRRAGLVMITVGTLVERGFVGLNNEPWLCLGVNPHVGQLLVVVDLIGKKKN
jgi:hypothetical protein